MERHYVPKKVDHRTATWGPFLWQSRLLPSIVKEISRLGLTVRGKEEYNHSNYLAGLFTDEWLFKEEDRKWIQEALVPWFDEYFRQHAQSIGEPYEKTSYDMKEAWINYQKANDFNPLHEHTGTLSYVLYLNVPEEIQHEQYNWKNRGHKPGSIIFRYGESRHPMLSNIMSYMPTKADFFIFPAWLEHMVIPFKTPDVERVSVSGNIYV